VSDNGCGVPPENASRVFQPYFTTKKHGTGLGLFVTHRLVTDHGGTVTFESHPGEGTVFRVSLPVSVPRSHTASPQGDALRLVNGEQSPW
jgi:signal transduction histidine kinase